MISIGKLVSADQAVAYLTESATDDLTRYYTGRGERAGWWNGLGAQELGLTGEITAKDFRAVLEGRNPATGEDLGRRWGTRKVSAYDVTFSVPKSVSIMFAIGDRHIREEILAAHELAVSAVADYIERNAGFARKANSITGEIEAVPAQLVMPRFTHRSARPVTDALKRETTVDPQLHTHIPIPAWVRRHDGSWSALHSAPLYRHAATAGAIGQAMLRHELSRRLGLEMEMKSNHTFEIAGISRSQRNEFSRRSIQIDAIERGLGIETLAGHKLAVLATRQNKSELEPGPDLFAEWRRRAESRGLTLEDVRALVGRAPLDQEHQREWTRANSERLLGLHGLTRENATFTRRDVIRALADTTTQGASFGELEAQADAILGDAQLVTPLGVSPRARDDEPRFSTPEMVALEGAMLYRALDERERNRHVMPRELVDAVIADRPTLTAGQRAMIEKICLSSDGVIVVEGAAGSGKTFALEACREAFESKRLSIVGCAVAARAAKELEHETRIRSSTIAWLRGPRGYFTVDVLIVDEAGMVGSRQMADLIECTQTRGRKLVLIGDSHQLQPVESGGAFRALGDHLGRTALDENVRQREEWERNALAELRSGDVDRAVADYVAHGGVVECPNAHDRRVVIAETYLEARAADQDVVILARTRGEASAMNELVRAALVERGDVSGPAVTAGDREFAIGDEVMCLKNDRNAGLTNGLRGTVTHVNEHDRTMTLRSGTGKEVAIDVGRYGHLDHGYAMTVHKAQGLTTDVALVVGSQLGDREWNYTAMSRDRVKSVYFTIDESAPRHRNGDAHELEEEKTTTQRLRDAWAPSKVRESTLDYDFHPSRPTVERDNYRGLER